MKEERGIAKEKKGMIVGYARVSTEDQNLHMQLDALTNADCVKIYEEKISGKSRKRPELDKMLEMLRPGDRVVVWKLDRIGRSMRHLMDLMDFFEKNEIQFVSLQENIDTRTATGRMMFNIMAALAQFEREMIQERTRAGLEAARARGRKGGRPRVDSEAVQRAIKLYDSKEYTGKEIEEMTGVSRSTLYKRLAEMEEQK